MSAEVLAKLAGGNDMTFSESESMMADIADGLLSPIKSAAFLTALAIKGETSQEIAGCIQAFRTRALKVPHHQITVFDCCGTGGDFSGSFNISTATAFVVAACDVPTAKHGNRSITSQCGSADVLERIGVNIQLGPISAARCLDEIGICFLFAPQFHPAMRNVATVRKELGFRTVFNLLGPLLNPAEPTHQIIGVPSLTIGEKLSQVATHLKRSKVWLLHNSAGLDELAPFGKNLILSGNGNGLGWHELEDNVSLVFDKPSLKGGSSEDNAKIIMQIFDGADSPGRLAVELNAGVGLTLVGKTNNFEEGMSMAREAIDSGKAREKLDKLVELSNKLGKC